MKFVTAVACLFASLAASAPVGNRPHNQPANVPSDVLCVTVYTTTTIWIDPEETQDAFSTVKVAQGNNYQANHQGNHQPGTTVDHPLITTTAAPVTSEKIDDTTTSVPAPVMTEAEILTTSAPTLVTSEEVEVPSSSAVIATTAVEDTTSSNTGADYTGEMTYYEPGLGSCGVTSSSSESVCALAGSLMQAAYSGNTNNNPLCGSTISINYDGNTYEATVVDTCPECAEGDLDVSPTLFSKFADQSEGRLHGVTWSFV